MYTFRQNLGRVLKGSGRAAPPLCFIETYIPRGHRGEGGGGPPVKTKPLALSKGLVNNEKVFVMLGHDSQSWFKVHDTSYRVEDGWGVVTLRRTGNQHHKGCVARDE